MKVPEYLSDRDECLDVKLIKDSLQSDVDRFHFR